MQTVVVGIADTETSQVAGRTAFDLASRYGAHVHVVTAVEPADPTVLDIGSDRYVLDNVAVAESAISEFVKSIAPDIEWSVHAVDSKPASALVEVATEVDADLIVVGNVRMQGIGRVLGSVGNDVVHHAPCSVLIVKTV